MLLQLLIIAMMLVSGNAATVTQQFVDGTYFYTFSVNKTQYGNYTIDALKEYSPISFNKTVVEQTTREYESYCQGDT